MERRNLFRQKKMKFYKNVEFGPIMKLEYDALLLDHVAPSGLHIIDLGPPNPRF